MERRLKKYFIAWVVVWLVVVLMGTIAHAETLDGKDIRIDISGTVDDNMAERAVKTIKSASAKDTIYVYINSSGGEYWAGMRIAYELRKTKAKTIGVVTKEAASAAAQILIATDIHQISESAKIMFHLPYYIDNRGEVRRDPPDTVDNLKREVQHFCLDQKLGEGWLHYAAGQDVLVDGNVYNKLPKIDCDKDGII